MGVANTEQPSDTGRQQLELSWECFVERVDRMFSGVLSVAFALTGAALMAWGALILGAQCFAWLKFGHWQQVPAFAAMLTPSAQNFQLVPMALFDASWSPLAVAPSIGSFESSDAVSSSVGGSFQGINKVASEVISWPLSTWMAVLGVGCVSAAMRIAND